MTEIEFQVHVIVFAVCTAFFFASGGFYALRRSDPTQPPPLGKGLVSTAGFGLVDLAGVSMYLLFYASGFFLAGNEPKLTAGNLVFAFFFQLGMAAFVYALIFWRLDVLKLWGVKWSRWWMAILALPTVFVMYSFIAVLEMSGYNTWVAGLMGGEATQEMVTALREETNVAVLILMSLVTVIGAPFSEEVIFRGYIYPAMKRFAGIPGAVVISGALFAAVHFNLAALLPLFILGMILAVLYEATGSLWMPIAVHCLFNMGTVVVQNLMRVHPEWFEEAEEAAVLWFG